MKSQQGFTLVELIVVITVSAVLALGIFQLTSSVNNLATDSSQRVRASNLAYDNLRKFADGTKPTWFDCVTYNAGGGTPLTIYSSSAAVTGLQNPVTQTVIASAPYGCGASGAGMPIRIQSQVTYGAQSRVMTHATYATY